MALKVKKFSETAKLPTVAHPGMDLGFDIYADETVVVRSHGTAKVKTGIGVEITGMATGFLVKDRSSMAIADLHVLGGVIDAGYRGEISVIFANVGNLDYTINQGDKIAQMVPIPTLTRQVIEEVAELSESSRGVQGFGSSDKPKIEVVSAVPKIPILR